MTAGGAATPDLDARVRWWVYQHFRESGRPPPLSRLARLSDATSDDTAASLARLHDEHALVLSQDGRRILMAHPFASDDSGTTFIPDARTEQVPMERYSVNCPWDGLALAGLLGVDGDVRTSDAWSGDPLRLEVQAGRLRASTTVLHFLVPAARFWDDIGFT